MLHAMILQHFPLKSRSPPKLYLDLPFLRTTSAQLKTSRHVLPPPLLSATTRVDSNLLQSYAKDAFCRLRFFPSEPCELLELFFLLFSAAAGPPNMVIRPNPLDSDARN